MEVIIISFIIFILIILYKDIVKSKDKEEGYYGERTWNKIVKRCKGK